MKFTGTILFVSAAYLASLVSAEPIVSITSPLINTRYKAGSEAIISWINPSVATIPQIVLAKGKSNALQPLHVIATNVNAQDMKYVWKIPFEIDNADDYAFELGNSPDLAFAGPFTIEGGVGGNPASSSNTTVGTANSVPAAAPASPATGGGSAPPNNAAAPASAASTAGTSSTSHSASASHAASAATKEQAGQAVAAIGLVAAFASQFF
ncbi:hypothetical protein INT47_006229 [Mucor saturninus]|uniref:Yeast cell wall synthesis Kre9/Knh1-like N-terminal domain-containing protein n=1 Tax=Mucor saturninus TaxID=64648 RepID=A0A8H7R076_9FUNG|nr:hypothetical protein INT47_006229 [Mucor saturninus]